MARSQSAAAESLIADSSVVVSFCRHVAAPVRADGPGDPGQTPDGCTSYAQQGRIYIQPEKRGGSAMSQNTKYAFLVQGEERSALVARTRRACLVTRTAPSSHSTGTLCTLRTRTLYSATLSLSLSLSLGGSGSSGRCGCRAHWSDEDGAFSSGRGRLGPAPPIPPWPCRAGRTDGALATLDGRGTGYVPRVPIAYPGTDAPGRPGDGTDAGQEWGAAGHQGPPCRPGEVAEVGGAGKATGVGRARVASRVQPSWVRYSGYSLRQRVQRVQRRRGDTPLRRRLPVTRDITTSREPAEKVVCLSLWHGTLRM